MPPIFVYVYCLDCQDLNDENKAVEMQGSEEMYENKEIRIQSREFKCPECGHTINVMLSFGGTNDWEDQERK